MRAWRRWSRRRAWAIRRHRPEVAGAGGAFRLRQGLLCLDRRLSAAHRPRRHRGTRRVAQRQPRQPVRKLEHALSRKSHTTVLEVDLDAMTHNLNYFRSHLRPGVQLVAMVKAASYGAGDFEVAQLLQHQGVDYLAVAFADEGVLLRERGITMPVVVLNADADSFDAMAANRLEPEIYSLRSLHEFAAAVERYGEQRYPIHAQARYGNASSGLRGGGVACAARCARPLRADGAWRASSRTSCTSTIPRRMISRDCRSRVSDCMSSRIAEALPYPVLRHTANSAAIERFPGSAVRHVPAGAGALRLRSSTTRRVVLSDAAHPHRADQAAGSDGDGGLRPCGGVVGGRR